MLPPIFGLLKAAPAVTAIIGDPPAAFRHGQAPQGTSAPYVTYFVVDGVPENVLDGTPPHDRMVMQVDCFHATDARVEALATAVRDALEASAHMTGIVINQREPDTGLYRIGLQFDFLIDR